MAPGDCFTIEVGRCSDQPTGTERYYHTMFVAIDSQSYFNDQLRKRRAYGSGKTAGQRLPIMGLVVRSLSIPY